MYTSQLGLLLRARRRRCLEERCERVRACARAHVRMRVHVRVCVRVSVCVCAYVAFRLWKALAALGCLVLFLVAFREH